MSNKMLEAALEEKNTAAISMQADLEQLRAKIAQGTAGKDGEEGEAGGGGGGGVGAEEAAAAQARVTELEEVRSS